MMYLIPITGKYSKLDLLMKKLICTSNIRPLMTSASPVWASATPSDIHKLQVVQNRFLKISTIAHFVRDKILYADLNWIRWITFSVKLTKKGLRECSIL
ncbi:hypothetical protein X975_25560, partial [Stegodyphus mimosarum]